MRSNSFLPCDVTDFVKLITNISLQFLSPEVAQAVIRFLGGRYFFIHRLTKVLNKTSKKWNNNL